MLSRTWKIRLAVIIWFSVLVASWNFLSLIMDMLIKRPVVTQSRPVLPPATGQMKVKNPQGDEIAAWWYQGKPDAGAILICHGHGVTHLQMDDIVSWLLGKGLTMLLLDFRAHGESGGTFSSLGLHEWEDIDAVLKESEKRGWLPPTMPLAAFGRSMGAVSLINGCAKLPRINAFIIESMYAKLRSVAENDFRWMLGFQCNPLVDLAFLNADFRTGIRYEDSLPVENIRGLASRPVLIIHDELDHRADTQQFESLCRAAPHARTLVIKGAGHVQGLNINPELFKGEILDFLASSGVTIRP
ncbi:MAG: alpha/beta hydrolase [Candidatus Riflebacteria bacterium]|nr:alpha/beta hydrolase [Candidatus Riflebacteria bacterium]